jgi:hypothetical protein
VLAPSHNSEVPQRVPRIGNGYPCTSRLEFFGFMNYSSLKRNGFVVRSG